MSDLLTFSELLAESQATDFRTPEMITESENSARQWVDANYITVTKISDKDIIKAMNSNKGKALITTNGEWKISAGMSGRWWSLYAYKTDKFYKNGTSPEFDFSCNDDGTRSGFYDKLTELYAANHNDLEKTFQALVDFYSVSSNQPSTKIYASKEDISNRSAKMFQPFTAAKNVKPYAKPLPTPDKTGTTKLTRDDVSKMIMSGQTEKIVVSYSYSDDSRYDVHNNSEFEGNAVDPIRLLINDLLGSENSFTRVYWNSSNGRVYVSVSPHSNKSYNVILDEKKFKK